RVGLFGSTAKPLMRPDVNAGPIERSRRPLNVGVDIGSRGVGDASGVAVALGLGEAATEGDGEGDGCCAATLTRQTTNNDIKSSARAHAEVVIRDFPSSGCVLRRSEPTDQTDPCFTNSSPRCLCRKSVVRCHASAAASSL